jgi:nitrite reductase/ring-hydroxylating ferredoxin subunit
MKGIIHNIRTSVAALFSKGLIAIVVAASCSQDLSDDNIPLTHFPDIVINISLPSNIVLASKGGYKLINEGGVRGIIVYCQDVGIYHAYERNCSYTPNEACATVNVDPSNLFMIDPCCGSSFDFTTGEPIGGVAWRPLRKYQATANGSELTITENIIN